MFAALLDLRRGGSFQIHPSSRHFQVTQQYEHHTNILETKFRTAQGTVKLVDFMPCFEVEGTMVSSGEIHRRVSPESGEMDLELRISPRVNYGSVVPIVERARGVGYCFTSPDQKEVRQKVSLLTDLKFDDEVEKGTLTKKIAVKEKTDPINLVFRYGSTRMCRSFNANTEEKLKETREFWRRWISRAKYDGMWKEQVLRSALVLKLLQYSPTGAIIAAPTTSLPEEIGGSRNWDYRFSWIRDSSFVIWAFHSLGFEEEQSQFLDWILSILYLTEDNVQILLGIGGEKDLGEQLIPTLEGYRRSSPVREGNAAWDQFQLDVYGILLDALYFSHKHGGGIEKKVYLQLVRPLVDSVLLNWEKPDCGIWEVRKEEVHFVYSKMWCWVAVDRAAKMAKSLGETEDERKWSKERDRIYEDILKNGFNTSMDSFVQTYRSSALDAANLLMPQVGFMKAGDPKMKSTVRRIQEKLVNNKKFVYRYLTDDGLPGREGAFLICSFWLVKCLTLEGRLEEAQELLQSLIPCANHTGLFSEEIDPKTGEMLGNFPQGYTHMGFITAAVSLGRAIAKKRSNGY